jgi:choline dehydrogenase-like flavoprotein
MAPDSLVNDREHPYTTEAGSRFNWFRAHQLGGRMTIPGHGRQYYRLSERDLAPSDGLSPPWCLTAAELNHWYDFVEGHLGLSGGDEHNPWVPDARLATVLTPTDSEADAIGRVRSRWTEVRPILGRSAAPHASLDAAARTSRLFCRRGAIVREVQVDQAGQTRGVSWYDLATGRHRSARANLVFLCTSTLETTRILLLSRVPGARIGAASGALGRYLMDHILLSAEGVGGALPGEPVFNQPGRCIYLPRFDLRSGTKSGRGHGVLIYRWSLGRGRSYFRAVSLAEMTPRPENTVVLDPTRRDAWDSPVVRITCRYNDVEMHQASDQSASLRELAELFGVRLHTLDQIPAVPGTAIHECGTARMGRTPEESVLDPHNQCWDARGLYVTDGAAFPSQGVQNPTLTILALTARACDHAVRGRQSAA